MLGRVIAVLFSASLLFTISAFPQCDYSRQFSGEYRASMFDISIDVNDLWAASGYGVQLYDRSVDPPELVAAIGLPGLTRLVRGANGIAYAAGTTGISVIARDGRKLRFVRTIATPAVNDLYLQSNALFAATTAGIVEFNLIDPQNPGLTSAKFPTSATSVTGLAVIGSTLYAADGDSSVEAFSIAVPSSPQTGTSLTSLTRGSALEAVGTRLYVSDGQRTEVFALNGSSMTSAGTFPFPATSLADAGANNIVAVAGNDRVVRAIDATIPQNYVELFEDELPPTGGTVNRITAIRSSGQRLYVAGGDSGLATYDISRFVPPFPLLAYGVGTMTSIVISPDVIIAGRATSGIQEMKRQSTGSLVTARQWSGDPETVQDLSNGFLLSSSGATLKFWTVTSTTPTLLGSTRLRAAVNRAFLTSNAGAVVLLADGTMWTVDLSQTSPVPVRVATSTGPLTLLTHDRGGVAATEINADGTTTLHRWSGDLNAAPVNTTVTGVATALAGDGLNTALFTFRGITYVDPTGRQTLLPGSNSAVVTALDIANASVFALTDTSILRIWSLPAAFLLAEISIPGSATAIAASRESAVVAAATSAGIVTVNYQSGAVPRLIGRSGGNSYYRKAAASSTRLFLFDGRLIDMYELGSSAAPRWLGSISAPGAIDLAASDTSLFTLSSNQVISEYSNAGALLRSQPLNEGTDVTPLSIAAVKGAAWVSYSRGCTTTGCEKRTDVLDPQTLVHTASIAGGVVDVSVTGSRAYALFDLPSEARVYDVTDPLHPSVQTSRANDVNAVAIASSSGSVYLLGDKIYTYSESSLTKTGEQLSAVAPAATADLIIDSGCATIAGRSTSAENYVVPQWSAAQPAAVPGSIRTMALSGGRLLILTDYSIEVWSRAPASGKPKRHAVAP